MKKGGFVEYIKKFWNKLNGKKTLSGLVLIALTYALSILRIIDSVQAESMYEISLAILGLGAGHKLIKALR